MSFLSAAVIVVFLFLNVHIKLIAFDVFFSGLMFGFTRLLYPSWLYFSDCLMFGAIVSATDPGRQLIVYCIRAHSHFHGHFTGVLGSSSCPPGSKEIFGVVFLQVIFEKIINECSISTAFSFLLNWSVAHNSVFHLGWNF